MKNSTVGVVGVVGASGRLGALIADTASRNGFAVRRISGRVADAGETDGDLDGLAAVIVAAPMTSNAVHRRALEAGCHVIDVGIIESTIKEALSLDGLAKERNVALIVMAGLAPGLSGLLALHVARRFPHSARIDVVLVQNAQGTAGERGVRDMLDMLTDLDLSPITQLDATAMPSLAHAVFGLPSPERGLLGPSGGRPVIRYQTVFDRPLMNRTIRTLRWVRNYLPRVYEIVRNRVAAAKAKRAAPMDEAITLGAIASGANGATLGYEGTSLSSDYGATARIAVALARMAITGELAAGAGHPARFTDWPALTDRAFS